MKAKKYMMGGYGTQQQMPMSAQTPMMSSSMPMQAQRKPMTKMAKGGMAMCGASVPPAQKRK